MVFAPAADVATQASPVADRAYSSDPRQVAVFVRAAMDGWSSAQVIPAVGNFPGEGGASADPNVAQATVGGSLAQLRAGDLVPFAGIASRAPAIVVSNAIYAAFDGVTPAVLLPEAISLLRDDLGFGGVVVSSDLGATVQATAGQIGPTAVQALKAGCDLLYVQGNSNDEEAAYRAVLAAARSGKLHVLPSVQRILALKARYGIIKP
jgi:beta-N-acetylhexosaminidase